MRGRFATPSAKGLAFVHSLAWDNGEWVNGGILLDRMNLERMEFVVFSHCGSGFDYCRSQFLSIGIGVLRRPLLHS